MKVGFSVKTSGLEEIDLKLAQLANKAEIAVANEVLKDTDPYVPALNGVLSGTAHTVGNLVIYDQPYARYQYYGKVVVGPKYGPKHATNKDLVYTKGKHPNAQSHWFEASKAQNLDKWVRVAEKAIEKDL